MPPNSRLETILGKLQMSLAGIIATDNCVQSEHHGEVYSISRVVVSPKGRVFLQVTYDDGTRRPILLDEHAEDIISLQPIKPKAAPSQPVNLNAQDSWDDGTCSNY